MLSFYYWYSIIASIILGLYLLPFSELNTRINPFLLLCILLSIIISYILGRKYKENFAYYDIKYEKNKYEYWPLIGIVVLSIVEFIYAGDIPLISVTIFHNSAYKAFQTIPILHVFISMIALYYSTIYIYKACSYKENRKQNIAAFGIINFIMILFNMRSFLMFSLFIALNILYGKLRSINKVNRSTIFVLLASVVALLYGFGLYGNGRQGYKMNDSQYIERIGLYTNWPLLVPKEYMWTYSYVTSPLANINYNIENNNSEYNISGYIYQFLPESISKRLPNYDSRNKCELQKEYFNVSTGYCESYANMGFVGIIIFWLVIMFFPILLFRYNENIDIRKEYVSYISIYSCCVVFMFFTNMFSYGGTAPALWLSLFILIMRKKIISKRKKENEKKNEDNVIKNNKKTKKNNTSNKKNNNSKRRSSKKKKTHKK